MNVSRSYAALAALIASALPSDGTPALPDLINAEARDFVDIRP